MGLRNLVPIEEMYFNPIEFEWFRPKAGINGLY